MKKDGRATLNIPADLHKQIGHYAIDHDISAAEAVRRAWEWAIDLNPPAEVLSQWLNGAVPASGVQDHKPVPLTEQGDDASVAADTLSPEERDLQHAVVALIRSDERGIAEAVKALLRPYVGVQFDDKKETAGNRNPGDATKRPGKPKRVA
jgi:hypothetical protein